MNLWLCEHVDLKLMDQLRENRSQDILVHGVALEKFRASRRNFPVSPMHWLNKTELLTYRDEKIAWDKRSRQDIKQSFAIHCADEGRFGINPEIAGALERLFYFCSYGCLDALIFALSFSKSYDGNNSPVRIILGGNYRLTELVALVWWLAVCNRQFGKYGIEYIWVSRYASAVRVDSIHEALILLSGNTSKGPQVDGFIPENIRTGKEPICLAWVAALRHPRGWDAEIHRRIGEPMRILRVAEPNSSFHHDSPCIEMAAGNGGSQESLHWLLQCADDALSAAWESLDSDLALRFNHMGNAIHAFFLNGVAPFVLGRISRMVDRLDQELGLIDLQGFFSTTAPFIESIALHEWARRRSILPVLLPHSYTSSHDFPAVTYKASLTFISSALIMPSAHDDPGSLAKEEAISFNLIRSQSSLNSKRRKGDGGKKYKNVRLLFLYPFGQMWRMAWKYCAQFVASFYSRRLFKHRLKKAKLKIGFLLNFEHFEFSASLDFNDLFRFIADTARKLAELLPRGDAMLVVRRKPGWTNLHLLGQYLRNVKLKSYANNVIISPDRIPLEEFGALCDVVLYFQGTSAAPELMSLGVPVVQLTDPNAPVMLDKPYIVFPEEIVPSMTIEEIMIRFQVDPEWLVGLSRLQKDWISTQMVA
jgi:hypothetical protein